MNDNGSKVEGLIFASEALVADRAVLRAMLRQVLPFTAMENPSGGVVCLGCGAVLDTRDGKHAPECIVELSRILIKSSEHLDQYGQVPHYAASIRDELLEHLKATGEAKNEQAEPA